MNNDLISKSALLEFAHNHVGGTVDCNDIARFPAVDAEVVRCKDCKESREHECFLLSESIVVCLAWAELVPANGFCYKGKKKDAEVEG